MEFKVVDHTAYATEISCPKCGSNRTRQTTTWSISDLWPPHLSKSPQRCRRCRERFYVGSNRATGRRGHVKRKRSLWRTLVMSRSTTLINIAVAIGAILAFVIFLLLVLPTAGFE